ncbi:hypothetical protein FI667_g8371, partial [Globisporangium splendens]
MMRIKTSVLYLRSFSLWTRDGHVNTCISSVVPAAESWWRNNSRRTSKISEELMEKEYEMRMERSCTLAQRVSNTTYDVVKTPPRRLGKAEMARVVVEDAFHAAMGTAGTMDDIPQTAFQMKRPSIKAVMAYKILGGGD